MKEKNVEQKSVELKNQTNDSAAVGQDGKALGNEELLGATSNKDETSEEEEFAPIPEGTELSAEAIIKSQRETISSLRKQVAELAQQLESTKNE